MRFIPGKTKVRIELFKGVSIADVIVAAIGLTMVILVILSPLPLKYGIAIAIFSIASLLLLRLDTEPTYVMLLHIVRHFGYVRRYARVYDDSLLKKKDDKEEMKQELAKSSEEETQAVKSEEDAKAAEEAAKEKKEQAKLDKQALKELIKQEEKILKSKTATEEEKNAVWLARAERSAAKKQAKKDAAAGKEENASYAFMDNIIPFTGIKENLIEYGGSYYGAVIEIDPVEFRFFSAHRRNNSIEAGVGRVLRSVHMGFSANIVKIERPIIYDSYIEVEKQKLAQLRKSFESGMMSESEFMARVDIENDRLNELKGLCTDHQVVAPFYYIVLFESDKKQLNLQVNAAMDNLRNGELTARRLDDAGLAVFLKYTNQLDFDEREIKNIKPEDYVQWAMPEKLLVKARTVEVNDIVTHNFRVVNYPSLVGDAWLAGVMSLPSTKVVVKCSPMDRAKAIRTIDHSLQELRGQYNATGVDSKRIELQSHIETLGKLLVTLQGEGEELMECNIYITAYDLHTTNVARGEDKKLKSLLPDISGMKKHVRRTWQESNFRLNALDFDQMEAFIATQISAYDPQAKQGRGIPSNSIAAAYPWIYAHIADKAGFKLGVSDGVPVFIDFFRRDSERVNSNMVIIGKSGSGKSYATKSLLSNLASEDAKIFILDPENEYSELAHNLHGKVINVANSQYGRLNPFHIITALDDDEGETAGGSFATHLQFLEEFYRQILPEIDKDSLEYLNNLTERLYTNKGIMPETDLSKLTPDDYPIFDDLYDSILEEFERTDNEYIRSLLRSLINYVAKFSTGGRNSNIWNGPSSVTTEENFTVFNFQAMLSNRNTTIANAQMLLVLKYIDNEIIKNRDYNTKYGLKRKVVVVIDEAHVFIDSKYPVALDFMFQLAKRIRKYNGMQIVITQNIKDFVGSEEIARKSTAIINACQYSFIFALAPNDMQDLCKLYEKAGGINENEQERIIQAPRGQAFTIMSASSRSTFRVEVPKNMVDMFQDQEHPSVYYSGEQGEKYWEEFIGESREIHDRNYNSNKKDETVESKEEPAAFKKSKVIFEEVSEDYVAPAKKSEELGKIRRKPEALMEDAEFDMSDDDIERMLEQKRAEEAAAMAAATVAADPMIPRHAINQGTVTQPAPQVQPTIQPAAAVQPGEMQTVALQTVAAMQPIQIVPPAVDYTALMADIRSRVLSDVMDELKANGTYDSVPVPESGSRSRKPVVKQEEPEREDLYDEDEDESLADLLREDEEEEDSYDEDDELIDLFRSIDEDRDSDDEDSEDEDFYDEDSYDEDDDDIPSEAEDRFFSLLDDDSEEDEEEDELLNDLFGLGDEEEETEDIMATEMSDEDIEKLIDEEEEEEDADDEEYDFSSLFDSDEDEEDEDDDSGDFDIMSLLRSEAEAVSEAKDKYEPKDIDDLVAPGEVADITFDELGVLVGIIRKQHRKK